ncbi:unnamed protein product [Cyprideis torosa]|uniref:beta-galactoside alpha-(2,6)-sialyltransferase n=1 Tax=Cyprideis torosa TaxID=163714 RepID=A0A7R8W4A1_9CRUS|nr:unnamed protein product [Cyprideis torosa]CAG0881684.1 unnamed protein product [Cyprideis torosa]
MEGKESRLYQESDSFYTFDDKERGIYRNLSKEQLRREMFAEVRLETLGEFLSPSHPLRPLLPKKKLQDYRHKSCVAVSNSGKLMGSKLGTFIDSHDVVLRFNHAPTRGFERDVGSKTTYRIVNNKLLNAYNSYFWQSTSNLKTFWDQLPFREILITYEDCNRIHDFHKNRDSEDISLMTREIYRMFDDNFYWLPYKNSLGKYIELLKAYPMEEMFYVIPDTQWALWDFLQRFTPTRINSKSPVSGFLATFILLYLCEEVSLVHFVPTAPSGRTSSCHYFEWKNPVCMYNEGHSSISLTLLLLNISETQETTAFETGILKLTGFSQLRSA